MRTRQERRDQSIYDKAYGRLSRLETTAVLDWCDLAGSGLARALGDYRRDRLPESLDEAKEAVTCLEAAVEVIHARRA